MKYINKKEKIIMNKNIKIAKQLIKIAKDLVTQDKGTASQLNNLQNKMPDDAKQLFKQFKEEVHRTIRTASEQSKAQAMIKQGLLKSKGLTGKALKMFLLALVTFVSLHCNIAKADVVKLDNGLKQVVVNTNNSIKIERLDEFVKRLSGYMKKQDAEKFKNAVSKHKALLGDKIKGMKINEFIHQVQSKYNMTMPIENALFDSELDESPAWKEKCSY